jgi:hypothetical protein
MIFARIQPDSGKKPFQKRYKTVALANKNGVVIIR